jgi:hypothetical protein
MEGSCAQVVQPCLFAVGKATTIYNLGDLELVTNQP